MQETPSQVFKGGMHFQDYARTTRTVSRTRPGMDVRKRTCIHVLSRYA